MICIHILCESKATQLTPGIWTHMAGLERSPNPDLDFNHSLLTGIIPLVSGLYEAHVLDVSSQKVFSERQSDRQGVDLFTEVRTPKTDCGPSIRVKGSEGHSVVSYSLRPHGLYSPWNSPSQNTRVGSLSLLQGIFPSQGSNPGFPHCRWILYQLSHKGSPLKGWEAPKHNGNSFLFIFKMNHLFTEPGADQIHIQFHIYIF